MHNHVGGTASKNHLCVLNKCCKTSLAGMHGDLDLDASNVRCTMMYLICSVILQSSYRSNISLAPEDLGHFFGLGLIGCCDSPVGKHKKMSLALLQNGLPSGNLT